MKCTKCQKKVHSSEIYTDYYYCKVCDRSYSLREDEGMTKDNPYPKDHIWCGCPECPAECFCSYCKIDRIEGLEKRFKELELENARLGRSIKLAVIELRALHPLPTSYPCDKDLDYRII